MFTSKSQKRVYKKHSMIHQSHPYLKYDSRTSSGVPCKTCSQTVSQTVDKLSTTVLSRNELSEFRTFLPRTVITPSHG